MMEVQAGPSSHQFQPKYHAASGSGSGTGCPTFFNGGGGFAGAVAGTGAGAGAGAAGSSLSPLSEANPSPYPGFPPANTSDDVTSTSPSRFLSASDFQQQQMPPTGLASRKRKADTQDNERLSKRLSKRLSLLNLEQNGNKLYVPVESPQLHNSSSPYHTNRKSLTRQQRRELETEAMQLDDTKHKVYIYDLDDELSSSDGDESSDEARLVFLPDIEKHLLQKRIPPSVLANPEGELAGMQLVLYREPTSLTVPEERDSVRRAIVEARQRLREKLQQGNGRDAAAAGSSAPPPSSTSSMSPSLSSSSSSAAAAGAMSDAPPPFVGNHNGFASAVEDNDDNDTDAMEVD
ncbi:hypothetical protein DL764_002277 [Monosporascus ibericus]|uniref:Uncharacterized protein n=1 Tax=Monosporascus ibericus TaxID=155417 RepID=A0A4Q4TMU2_9PEZI|nr:hypothetical protein DL764_002277 [Monosporascus ibericus]